MTSPQPSSRSSLVSTAHKYRSLNVLLSWLDRYLSTPLPPRPSLTVTIQSTISKTSGPIDLLFFTDPSRASPHSKPKPALINYHGGGFCIGDPIDDARWLGSVLAQYPDAIIVSVGYRLAPEFPFPVGIEDGVDAILWLRSHAAEYNLDINRFVLCGDSAGGNLAFTVPLRLHEEMEKRSEKMNLAGIVAFYPSVDWTRTRKERDATNPIAAKKSMIPHSVFRFFDESYLLRENLPKTTDQSGQASGLDGDDGEVDLDMAHPYLSPALTPTSLLVAALPGKVAIYTCGWDQLLVEGNTFRDRLAKLVEEGRMECVGGIVIEDVIHGFDKKPRFIFGNAKRDRMYEDALRELGGMWRVDPNV